MATRHVALLATIDVFKRGPSVASVRFLLIAPRSSGGPLRVRLLSAPRVHQAYVALLLVCAFVLGGTAAAAPIHGRQ